MLHVFIYIHLNHLNLHNLFSFLERQQPRNVAVYSTVSGSMHAQQSEIADTCRFDAIITQKGLINVLDRNTSHP